MSYYDGDPWSNHTPHLIKCGKCGEEFDQQEKEGGNICPDCIDLDRQDLYANF